MKREASIIVALGLFFFAQAAQADWTPAKRLTWTSGSSSQPAVAIGSNDTIHVVWHDYTPGNAEIYYKRSTNGGTTWSAARRLTWTSGGSKGQVIALDPSDTLHVVWYDDTPGNQEVYYRRSADGGATWSAVKRLTWTSGDSCYPAIATGSISGIHVVWRDDTPGDWEVYYKRSADGGTTWGSVKRLTWRSGDAYFPAIAVDSNDTIRVVWDDDTSDGCEIYHKRSTDGGTTWSAAKRLTWTLSWSNYPAMTIDSCNFISIVWQDYTYGNSEICYKRSMDGGTTWSALKRLTWTSDLSLYPAIAADSSDHIHVVWEESGDSMREIYYKGSTDGGATWSTLKRLTWMAVGSYYSDLAIDSTDTIHVVWYCDGPGNTEIYYKSGN